MVTDLPDYEKKVIIVTVPGEYPGLIDINHKKILGVELKTPSIAACLPISIEHTVYIDHRAILGEALKPPTFANCVPASIENDAIAYDSVNDRFKVDIEAMAVGTIDVNLTDKWARQLGLIDISRVLGAALAHSNPVIVRLTNGTTWLDPTQIRALTSSDAITVYGSLDKLQQRATSKDLYVQLRAAGVEVDPTQIRALTTSDKISVEQSDETKLKATVSAADLDIRDLTSVSDSVEVKQATASNLNANVFTKHDNKTYKTAVFDASASGNLVDAVAGKVIKLHALTIQAQNTVVVNLNNGSGGASLMEWSFQAREGAVVPMANAPAYWAITSVNTALYVTLSAAVTVTITAIYSGDDAS